MKRILVTGGCGMIGSNLVKRLVREGWEVYVADSLWRGKLENLNGADGKPVIDLKTHFFLKDLSVPGEAEAVIGQVEYVAHLADVVAGIDYVFRNQGELFRINNLINSNVFHACRKAGKDKIKGILYVGTVCSFPKDLQSAAEPEPLREEELFPAMPESAYGWSKLIGQLELGYLERETGIPCCTLMLHNVYGTPTDFGARSQVIPALIRKAVRYPDEPFTVWGSGEQGRAFLHVDDAVEAIVLALEKGWGESPIQIGPSVCTSIATLAAQIAEISGKGMHPVFDTTKPEGDRARCADASKALRVLGWQPKVTLEDGLRQTYAWLETQLRAQQPYRLTRDMTVCGAVGLCTLTREAFVRAVFDLPTEPISAAVFLAGVPAVVAARENPEIAALYARASITAIDGMPIVRRARRQGFVCERCAAPDIMGLVFEESIRRGKTHYFYGGKDDATLQRLRENLERDYPGIRILGMYAPPFRPLTAQEDARVCAEINRLQPDFVWVGIGAPKQEKWIQAHRETIHGAVMLGVGAGFDFLAGTLAKAPRWMEEASLEWLFRLCQEPKRLWRRYLPGGVKYLYYTAEERMKRGKS